MKLNYNKIWSLINRENLSKAKAARIIDMSETGFKQMMERKTMSVSNLETIADYFKVSISWFFDNEEKQDKIYKVPDTKVDAAEEPLRSVFFCWRENLNHCGSDTIKSGIRTGISVF